jgi:hypothetical protein
MTASVSAPYAVVGILGPAGCATPRQVDMGIEFVHYTESAPALRPGVLSWARYGVPPILAIPV